MLFPTLGAHLLPSPRCLRPRVSAGDSMGNPTDCRENTRRAARSPACAVTRSRRSRPAMQAGTATSRRRKCRLWPPFKGVMRWRMKDPPDLAMRWRFAPGITKYIQRYQAMLAARQQDPEALRRHYQRTDSIILSIDGLQPEKGHETLYVVRELTGKRVWFAEALLSATADEVRRLIAHAKQWASLLDKTVTLWISDKQDAFITGITAEFPGVPHRYCANHFLRDLAQPVLESDSHAKVQMRKKVRGLRGIEQAVLKRRDAEASKGLTEDDLEAMPPPEVDSAGAVVLDYTVAVRGILNDDRGGPLHPPGLRMGDALAEVRQSIQRNLDLEKGGSRKSN